LSEKERFEIELEKLNKEQEMKMQSVKRILEKEESNREILQKHD
jgi:hypothetical protein